MPMSSGKIAELMAGCGCDPKRFRARYPDRWRSFLRAHFMNPTHVQFFFDVDAKTAIHWWEGTHSPQAWALDFAVVTIPTAKAWLEAA